MQRTTMTSQAKAVRVARRLQVRLETAGEQPAARALATATARAVETPWRPYGPLPADLGSALATAWRLRHAPYAGEASATAPAAGM